MNPRLPAAIALFAFLATACSRGQDNHCSNEFSYWFIRVELEKKPPPRFDHAMAVDLEGKRIFLFGGRDGSKTLDDLWVFDSAQPSWQRIESGSGPTPRGGHSLVYHPESKRLFLFGGFRINHFGEAEFLRELWIYADDSGWSREFFKEGPDGRAWHSAVIVDDNMVVFGGFSGTPKYYQNDAWALDLSELSFLRLAKDGGPKMAGSPALLPGEESGTLMVFGRDRVGKLAEAGLWFLDPNSNRWSVLDNQNSPAADFTLAVSNPWEKTMLVLRKPMEGEQSWRVWTLEAKQSQWCESETLSSSLVDICPTTPHRMVCAADPSRERSWVCFGGAYREQVGDETWLLGLVQR